MTTRIVELSKIIAEQTKVVDEYFQRNGLPTPTFDVNGPRSIQIPSSEHEASAALYDVLDATKELNLLLTGPAKVILNTSPMDNVSLHAIYHFKIAQALGIDETASYEDLSTRIGLNFIDLRRLLRLAMCNGIFCEPRIGYVSHTAASRLLAEDKVMFDYVGIATEDKFPAAAKFVEALVRYEGAHGPEQTGFSLSKNTNMGLYDFMGANYDTHGKRWAGAMNAFAALQPLESLLQGFDWTSIGNGTVVDVGGGWGPVSIGLAERFPDLNFIVQDLSLVVEEGSKSAKIPERLRSRIEFMPYDFVREKQPVQGAAVYFFRAIFHNWPDKYCILILRNQIPVLTSGARIVMFDGGLPDPGTLGLTKEKQRREMDVGMLMFFGSRERNVADWEQLLAEADSRFHLTSTPTATGTILVVEWKG